MTTAPVSAAASPSLRLSRAGAWALTLTATFTMAVSYFDRQTLAVLAPTVQAQLGISDQNYGWLVSAFSIAYLVGAPLSGHLIDRVGARRGLLGAVLLWSGVAALHALAPGFGILFALRIALGFAESPSFPGAAQTIHRVLPPADRARGLGVLFSGSSFGAMIVPLIAPFLAARYGFRVAFLGTAMVGLAWVPLWLAVAYRPAARAVLDAEPDDAGKAQGPNVPPLGPLALATHPAVLRAMCVVFASAPLLSLMFNWSAKYLVHDHGITQDHVGHYLWLPPLVFDTGAILFGQLAGRARARGAAGVPGILIAASAVLMVFCALTPFAGSPWAAVLMASMGMAGGGGLYALATTEMLACVPGRAVSAAGGMTAAAQSLAYIIVNPLIGRSIEATKSYTSIFVILSLWVVPGCVVWLLWRSAGKRLH